VTRGTEELDNNKEVIIEDLAEKLKSYIE